MFKVIEKPGQTITEPITLQEAKNHLRVDNNDDDALITALISAARQACENETRRSFVERSWLAYSDQFPYSNSEAGIQSQASGYTIPFGTAALYPRRGIIVLPWGPLKQTSGITSITYVDTDGNTQTVNAGDYKVDATSIEPRIEPAYSKSWAIARQEINAVCVEFIAGYSTCPPAAKAAMLLWLGALYENRQAIQTGVIAAEMPAPANVSYLLAQFRVLSA